MILIRMTRILDFARYFYEFFDFGSSSCGTGGARSVSCVAAVGRCSVITEEKSKQSEEMKLELYVIFVKYR